MNDVELLQRRLEQIEAERQQAEAERQQAEAERQQAEAERQQAEAERARVEEENRQLRQELEQKEHELKLLLKRLFGPKSERFVEDPNQLPLDFNDGDQVDDAIAGIQQAQDEQEVSVEGYTRQPRARRREELPDHLPREIVVIDLPEEEKEGLTCIGYDSTETLVYTPGQLHILEKRYPKYVQPEDAEAGVAQAPRERGLVEGNRYDTGVAAQVITAKFGYHLPIYRQQDIFAGCGWSPSRSTLLNLQVAAAEVIRPLAAFFADQVRQDGVVATDDTSVTLLLPKSIPKVDPQDPKSQRVHDVLTEALKAGKKRVTAKMWAYRGVDIPLNVFDFTVSRHRDGPDLFLIENHFQGTLFGDCYGANTGIQLRSLDAIVHAACVAHARRKVDEAYDNHTEHAKVLLRMFRQLYDIEDRGRVLDRAGLLELRQSEASAVWEQMRTYLDMQMSNVLPQEAMAKAVGYLNNQWEALTRYLCNPAIPIDNNQTEQLMKQVAIGRKNWLFLGSVAAGYRAADLMTLVSSAVRNDLDVWSYVKGVLDALLSGETNYASLLPAAWAQAHPDQVRTYRVNERAQRQARQQARRERRRV